MSWEISPSPLRLNPHLRVWVYRFVGVTGLWKEHELWGRQTCVQIVTLKFASCVTLGV